MRAAIATTVLVFVGACADSGPETIPTLEVTSPARGSLADGGSITVAGTAAGDNVQVVVNGTQATRAADGTWSVTIHVPDGIAIVETHATDDHGSDLRDVRAVLAGTLAPTDGSVSAPLGAKASPAALTQVGNAVASAAEAIDFTAAVQGLNPIVNDGGCLGARLDITDVQIAGIGASLVPHAGALATDVAVNNITVKVHASWKIGCIGGSSTITVHVAKARVHGDLGVAVSTGDLRTSISNVSVALDGFDLDVSGLPGFIVDLFNGKARTAIANALSSVIRDRVPGLANQQLAGLLAKPFNAQILGKDTTVDVTPTSAQLSDAGLYIAVDTNLLVAEGAGGMYVANPTPLTADMMADAKGLGIALADDTVNQLFAGLWTAGALDTHLTVDQIGPAAALLDLDAASLDVKLALPPTASTDGNELALSVGDLLIKVNDAGGAQLQQFAMSLRAPLSAEQTQSGKLALTVGDPEIKAQVLAQRADAASPLTDDKIEGIVTGVWGLVGQTANDALSKIPMPKIATLQLGAPSVSGRDGYVLADMPLN